jgi:hypothetical protein
MTHPLKSCLLGGLVAALSLSVGQTQLTPTTTVNWRNNGETVFRDSSGIPLSQGNSATNQDGMRIELGYYKSGTFENPFAGNWVPLTLTTSVGDSFNLTGTGNGRINFASFFQLNSDVVQIYVPGDPGAYLTNSSVPTSSLTPPDGQILAIRFYDTQTGETGLYNAVSSTTWLWATPSDLGSEVDINIGASALLWEDAANPFLTTIPEPSTVVLALCGGLLFVHWYSRRRRLKVGLR